MSYETTMARAIARDANEAWQRHRKWCRTCQPAARRRRYAELCPEGAGMRDIRDDLRKKAESEAALDKLPPPDQEALFSLEECQAVSRLGGGPAPPGPPPSTETPPAARQAKVMPRIAGHQ